MDRSPDHRVVGRFAPSPTGALHTGSLVAAVGSYLMAKQAGGRWLLRLDDLDTQRQVPGMADDIMRTLESFGLLWDGEVAFQSRHLEEYRTGICSAAAGRSGLSLRLFTQGDCPKCVGSPSPKTIAYRIPAPVVAG